MPKHEYCSLAKRIAIRYTSKNKRDLKAPGKGGHQSKLDEIVNSMLQKQLSLPSQVQQSIQNARY